MRCYKIFLEKGDLTKDDLNRAKNVILNSNQKIHHVWLHNLIVYCFDINSLQIFLSNLLESNVIINDELTLYQDGYETDTKIVDITNK